MTEEFEKNSCAVYTVFNCNLNLGQSEGSHTPLLFLTPHRSAELLLDKKRSCHVVTEEFEKQ